MKKIIRIIAILFICLFLVSCGKNKSNEKEKENFKEYYLGVNEKFKNGIQVEEGDIININANHTVGTTLIWKSNDDSIASISNGTLRALKTGKTKIIISLEEDTDNIVEVEVEVVERSTPVIIYFISLDEIPLGTILLAVNRTVQVNPTYTEGTTLVWESSDESIATVSDGLVKGISKGTTSITVSLKENPETKQSFNVTVNPIIQFYTVRWVNDDGSILEEDKTAVEGSIPVYYLQTPYKKDFEYYRYEFKGWDKEVEPIHSDVTYTATYNKTISRVKIVFDFTGVTNLSSITELYVDKINGIDFANIKVSKSGYMFKGWECNGVQIFDSSLNTLNELPLNFDTPTDYTFKPIFRNKTKVTTRTNFSEGISSIIGEGYYSPSSTIDVSVTVNPGYTFEGWYLKTDYYEKLITNTKHFTYEVGDEDIILYCKLEKEEFFYTVESDNSAMGLVSANGVDPVPIYVGSTIANESIELSAVTLGTNEFEGWYCNDVLVSMDKNITINPTAPCKYIAKWIKTTE